MTAPRMLFSLAAVAVLTVWTLAGGGRAHAADRPQALQALEEQGLRVMDEFKAGKGMRAFAASAGERPIAVYVMPDGTAIIGTRVNAKGEPLDEASMQRLVARPISDQTWAQLEAATWVRDGKADAPRVVYTFTDANCPYCHRFWEAARPWVDAGKVQLRHLMVGIIREDSPGKAAAILGAADRSAALLENELKFDRGGIAPAKSIPTDVRNVLEDNQLLMMSLGFRGTPGIVARDEAGLIHKYNGMPQADALEEVMGAR